MISETDLAYAAGLFDGEGSVSIAYRKEATKSTKLTYQVTAVLSMIDEPSILWLAATFGGKIDTKSRPFPVIYRWKLHSRKAADFFEMILPYLKLKHARAEAAIKLARMKRVRGGIKGHYGVQPMTDAEIEVQRPLAEFIRAANLRSNKRIASQSKWGVN